MKIDDKNLEKIFFAISQDKIHGIEELYSKCKKIVYSIAFTITKNKTDSEDIMQIVFAKIYEMDKNKFPIKKQTSWLYSVTKNETINYIKKNKKYNPIEDIYEISDNNEFLDKTIDKLEFNRIINKLKDKDKEIVSLKILSNFSFEEIGKMIDEPVGTVKWRYYKSIYSLKAILGNLAIFIISFTIGIKVMFSNKQKEDNNQAGQGKEDSKVQDDIKNLTISEENIFQDEFKDFNNENSKEQSIREDMNTSTNAIQNDNNTIPENIIYTKQSNNYHSQYVGYTFIGISIIFLIMTLIFLIKSQLRHRKKLSK